MKKGFTLIELLISMTIFSIVMISAINLFSAGIESQRRTLALQTLSNSTSYVIEYMSRAIRMAKKDLDGLYIDAGCNFKNPYDDDSKILFMSYHQYSQYFFLENGQIKERKGPPSQSDPSVLPLTSDNFEVTKLVFKLSGECQAVDELQPKVTIVIEIQTKEVKPQKLNLQTTISQRDLDIEY